MKETNKELVYRRTGSPAGFLTSSSSFPTYSSSGCGLLCIRPQLLLTSHLIKEDFFGLLHKIALSPVCFFYYYFMTCNLFILSASFI